MEREPEARVRVNLQTGEVEIAGARDFVEAYGERLEALMERLLDEPPASPSSAATPERGAQNERAGDEPAAMPPFGEWIQALAASATDVDRVLAAGYWRQRQSREDVFQTSEVNRLLLDHGVRVGNASQSVKQNVNAKRVFLLGKLRYRVASPGVAYLRQLMGAENVA